MSGGEVKAVPLAHKAEAALVRAALSIFRSLPLGTAARLGGGMARAIGPLLPVSKVADRNLQAAMPELDAAARKKIVAQVWENLGCTVAELAQMGNLHETASGPGYRVSGWEENVAPAMPKDGPVIFFTGHIGNWEILPPAVYLRGADVGFMYRAASNSLVNDIILRLREANFQRKVTMFPKGSAGARQAYAHMMRGNHLGLLTDQKLDNGISVPFFGRPAMTSPALASFALKFKCPVFPTRSVREGPARLHLIFEPPMALPDSGDRERDVLTMTTDMNNILERWIREQPGAWLWLHRRWPKTPR
jgi:Kdo2-lipid IVA lauroyltransferase/acyltransferase